jgi:phage pi2 protein 07
MPVWKITWNEYSQLKAKKISVDQWNMSNFMNEVQNQNGLINNLADVIKMEQVLEVPESQTVQLNGSYGG